MLNRKKENYPRIKRKMQVQCKENRVINDKPGSKLDSAINFK